MAIQMLIDPPQGDQRQRAVQTYLLNAIVPNAIFPPHIVTFVAFFRLLKAFLKDLLGFF